MYTTQLPAYTCLLLAVSVVAACSEHRVNTSATPYPLDYLRLHDATRGWLLHIEGDGSGYLQCHAVAGRKIIFPLSSLCFWPLPAHFSRCGRNNTQLSSPQCPRAVYFSELENRRIVCYCPLEDWMKVLYQQAYTQIKTNKDKSIDYRVLVRQWLQQPPLGREDYE